MDTNTKININSLNDFIDNKSVINELDLFFQSTHQRSILLVGPTGGGKTTLINCFVSKYNLQVLRPKFDEFSSHKEFVEFVYKFIVTRNFLELFDGKQKLLFLDDVDSLISNDRYAVSYLEDLIQSKISRYNLKVVLTCSVGNEKKLGDLRKLCNIVRLKNPSLSSTKRFIQAVCKRTYNKNLDNNVLERFCKAFECNIRSCIMNLNLFYNDLDVVQEESYHRVVFDKGICETSLSVIKFPHDKLSYLDIWISQEPILISYICFDNLDIFFKKTELDTMSYCNILSAYYTSSMLETFMFSKPDTILHDIYNVYRIGMLKHYTREHVHCLENESFLYTTSLTRTANYYTVQRKRNEYLSCNNLDFNTLLLVANIGTSKYAHGIHSSSFNSLMKHTRR